ncbi:hypothetical protein Q8F55_002545 [Vanrija albida]|uniref:Uncharacterized protein n=1 Tax=Vanrija albida TaxID=181172 RepID=A0ABR3QA39_9TREE
MRTDLPSPPTSASYNAEIRAAVYGLLNKVALKHTRCVPHPNEVIVLDADSVIKHAFKTLYRYLFITLEHTLIVEAKYNIELVKWVEHLFSLEDKYKAKLATTPHDHDAPPLLCSPKLLADTPAKLFVENDDGRVTVLTVIGTSPASSTHAHTPPHSRHTEPAPGGGSSDSPDQAFMERLVNETMLRMKNLDQTWDTLENLPAPPSAFSLQSLLLHDIKAGVVALRDLLEYAGYVKHGDSSLDTGLPPADPPLDTRLPHHRDHDDGVSRPSRSAELAELARTLRIEVKFWKDNVAADAEAEAEHLRQKQGNELLRLAGPRDDRADADVILSASRTTAEMLHITGELAMRRQKTAAATAPGPAHPAAEGTGPTVAPCNHPWVGCGCPEPPTPAYSDSEDDDWFQFGPFSEGEEDSFEYIGYASAPGVRTATAGGSTSAARGAPGPSSSSSASFGGNGGPAPLGGPSGTGPGDDGDDDDGERGPPRARWTGDDLPPRCPICRSAHAVPAGYTPDTYCGKFWKEVHKRMAARWAAARSPPVHYRRPVPVVESPPQRSHSPWVVLYDVRGVNLALGMTGMRGRGVSAPAAAATTALAPAVTTAAVATPAFATLAAGGITSPALVTLAAAAGTAAANPAATTAPTLTPRGRSAPAAIPARPAHVSVALSRRRCSDAARARVTPATLDAALSATLAPPAEPIIVGWRRDAAARANLVPGPAFPGQPTRQRDFFPAPAPPAPPPRAEPARRASPRGDGVTGTRRVSGFAPQPFAPQPQQRVGTPRPAPAPVNAGYVLDAPAHRGARAVVPFPGPSAPVARAAANGTAGPSAPAANGIAGPSASIANGTPAAPAPAANGTAVPFPAANGPAPAPTTRAWVPRRARTPFPRGGAPPSDDEEEEA